MEAQTDAKIKTETPWQHTNIVTEREIQADTVTET